MTAPHAHLETITRNTLSRLALALGITLAFVVVEAVAGVVANSLALLTDAAHNFTDVIALALSWYAMRMTSKPAHAGKTFGYHRVGILVALFNSTTLVLIALGIFYEAYHRLLAPPQVEANILTLVAAIAFVVNLVTALLVKRGSENDLNLRSAFVHLAGDAASTFAAILAGIGIMLTGWKWLDPLVSVFIALLILWNAWIIIREVIDILLESTPRDVDMDQIIRDLTQVDGVQGVHDLHVWSINQTLRALSAHIQTDDMTLSAGAAIQNAINKVLIDKHGIAHSILQLECVECESNLLYCDLQEANHLHSPYGK
jgi:cobalt-zinc-cadmium efflux system protein